MATVQVTQPLNLDPEQQGGTRQSSAARTAAAFPAVSCLAWRSEAGAAGEGGDSWSGSGEGEGNQQQLLCVFPQSGCLMQFKIRRDVRSVEFSGHTEGVVGVAVLPAPTARGKGPKSGM